MAYDLVIRGGMIIDGSGLARYRADLAVSGNRIAAIGRLDAPGKREIDAEGRVVTPGFVDGHTHMDAQVFWDPLGSNSCWHGVTSVVMGNCGFTLAPSRPEEHSLVMDNLERAEDIPAESMEQGIDWSWESFPQYMEAVARQPKAINYATQIGHSALRTFAMGERAFSEPATEADLELMVATLTEALQAGVVGFSTSVSDHHITPSGRPVASRIGSWQEVCSLVEAVGHSSAGLFQLAVETELTESDDVEVARSFWDRLAELAIATRVPVTYGLRREHLATQLEMFDRVAAGGGRMFGQCRSNAASTIYSFKTRMPFDELPRWRALRSQPLAAQLERLGDPAVVRELVEEVEPAVADKALRLPSFERLKVMRPGCQDVSAADLACERGVSPGRLVLDLARDSKLEQVFGRYPSTADDEELITGMRHPRTIMTFSDAGAHVSSQSGGDLQTMFLAEWVRCRQVVGLEEAVRMLTLAPAIAWRVPERGLLREGMIADINVFDPETIAPAVPEIVNDLPAGAVRVLQHAVGIASTIVGGREVFSEGEHTGELPGELIRARVA